MKKRLPRHGRAPASSWRLLCVGLGMAVQTQADIVTDWNTQAVDAVRSTATASPYAARDMAILHTAIYNAVEGIAGHYQTYTSGAYAGSGAGPGGASMEAAAAAAAKTVLDSLYPSLSGNFSTLYTSQLSGIADSQAKTDGIAWGQTVANDILAWRLTDGASSAQSSYTAAGSLGHWAPTPSSYTSPPLLPGWGNVTTFGITSAAAFQPAGLGTDSASYLLTSNYAVDYNEVKTKGDAGGLGRTGDETDIAWFWQLGSTNVTATGMWNQIAQTASTGQSLSLEENARLFAALNMVLADAGIVAWETKYDVDFWRPVTAILNGDIDGNGATAGDVNWTPLFEATALPEYVSSIAAFSGGAAYVLGAYLGDATNFTAGSDITGDGVADFFRSYTSFSDAAAEAAASGVYAGVNFRTSTDDGLQSGQEVGIYVVDNYFAPVPEPSGALLIGLTGLIVIVRRRRLGR